MAVLSTAVSSGRNFCSIALTTSSATLYTAPSANANVTSPSSTAYIKEIVLVNTTASALTVTLNVNGVAYMTALSIGANDTKVLSGLNTMMNAGATITGLASVAGCNVIISGTEVQ